MEQRWIDAPPPPPPLPPPQQPPPPPWQPQSGRPLQQQQHGQLYAQQDQAPSGLTQAVDWAAKAKAWMSAKSAQGQPKAVTSDPPESLRQPNGATSYHHFVPRPPELQQRPPPVLHHLPSVDPFPGSPSGVVWSVTPTVPHLPSQTFHPIQQPQPFTRLHGVPYRPAFAFGASSAVPVVDASQQKKAPVPSWLREELKKKVKAPSVGSVTDVTKKNAPEVLKPGTDSIPVSPGESETEGDEEENDAESAVTAVINQEIKRVLTEVLLKVTDGLFNEIAQEIFDEEEAKTQATEKRETDNIPVPSAAPARVVVAGGDGEEAEIDTNSVGNFLGLASYDSDDDQTEKIDKESTISDTEHAELPNTENPVVSDQLKAEKSTDRDQLLGRDSERNKENEGDGKLKEKKVRKERRTEHTLKDKRYDRHTPGSRSRSRSVSPRRSRSKSPSRRRSDKRRRSRSRSPRHHKRDSSRSFSRSTSRHKHSRSRSPGHWHSRR